MPSSLLRFCWKSGTLPCLAVVFSLSTFGVSAQPVVGDESAGTDEFRRELRQLVAEARDRVFPALVNIEVEQVAFYGGKEIRGRSVGSGTIFTSEGHVLTNFHVTTAGREFTCTLSYRQEISAILVGEDPLTDLAVLKLDLEQFDGELPVATFGQSAGLEVGDHVLAMGSPFALSRSVTLGIVSNVERVFGGGFLGGNPDEMRLGRGERTGLFTRWIQHDALINPGNSGGPLVSLGGEVVGINELGTGSMGFAIPIDLAREVAAALIAHGEVPRSRIGATFRPSGERGTRGALVASIEEGGPAARAGLDAGDILVALGGEPVDLRFPEEVPTLMKRIADQAVGSALKFTYRRAEVEVETEVVTEKLTRDRGKEVAFRAWGLSAQAITKRLGQEKHLADKAGVLVSGVRPGGPAQLAEPPLLPGDLLRSVNGTALASIDDWIGLYEEETLQETEAETLLVEFERQGRNYLTLLEPELDEDEDRPRELPKAWLGIASQPLLRELAEHLQLGGVQGFRVTRIYPSSKAAAADLQVGDVILDLNGEVLSPEGMQDAGLLARRVQRLDIGAQAALTVLRDGERRQVEVTLDRSRITPQEANRDRDINFDLVVREVTFFDRDEQSWGQDVRGVLVDVVDPSGWAGLGGLRPGDLIQQVGGEPVRGLKSYRRALAAVSGERSEKVAVLVLRGQRIHFRSLEPEWSPVSLGESE